MGKPGAAAYWRLDEETVIVDTAAERHGRSENGVALAQQALITVDAVPVFGDRLDAARSPRP